MNDHLARNEFTEGFVDPGYFDTELTTRGREQARALREEFSLKPPRVDTLISSPLKRALETAEIAFEGSMDVQRLVTPLAAERLRFDLVSDGGSSQAHER